MEKSKTSETALTLQQEKEATERQRLKRERKEHRLAYRQAHLKHVVARVLVQAGRHVDLKAHVFKTDAELVTLGLKPHEIAIVRQWEVPKRNAAYAVESSSKLLEAQTRGQAGEKRSTINVENVVIQLPEKRDETIAPVIIDVVSDDK